ncbi:hypothetical protein ACC734_39550, partial [Rhizobium ruizarguesonis]
GSGVFEGMGPEAFAIGDRFFYQLHSRPSSAGRGELDAFVELHEKATTAISREFLLRLIAAVHYKIHTVLTDNGIQFTTP